VTYARQEDQLINHICRRKKLPSMASSYFLLR